MKIHYDEAQWKPKIERCSVLKPFYETFQDVNKDSHGRTRLISIAWLSAK